MSDLNDRIAKAKGWVWSELPSLIAPYQSVDGLTSFRSSVPTHWYNPEAEPAFRPNFTGTLEGVAGMMRELNEREEAPMYWTWGYCPLEETVPMSPCYIVTQHCGGVYCMVQAHSDPAHPGDCVGEAWLSVFGKEAADAL